MITKLLFHALCCYLFICIFLIVTQHLQLFPGALQSLFRKVFLKKRHLPPFVESSFIETDDKKRIEVWKLPGLDDVPPSPYRAVIFHGNAGSLDDFLLLQLWCRDRGMTSYSFDYRGYGRSRGFPHEKGIFADSDAFISHVLKVEACTSDKLVVIGFSVGGAPAARSASLHDVHTLALISSFTSVDDVIRDIPLFGFLRFANVNKLSTIRYIQALKNTHLILVHSEKDKTVPYSHANILLNSYQGSASKLLLTEKEAGHNTTFYMQRYELASSFRKLGILHMNTEET